MIDVQFSPKASHFTKFWIKDDNCTNRSNDEKFFFASFPSYKKHGVCDWTGISKRF